jgi:hypothetical protein
VLGLDNYETYRKTQRATNFRARLLTAMHPSLLIHDDLEKLFAPAIRQQNGFL